MLVDKALVGSARIDNDSNALAVERIKAAECLCLSAPGNGGLATGMIVRAEVAVPLSVQTDGYAAHGDVVLTGCQIFHQARP